MAGVFRKPLERGVIMFSEIECACGCGNWMSCLGANGKPRRYLRGHQNRGRKCLRDEKYWETRVQRLQSKGKICACGCGERVLVSLEWLKEAASVVKTVYLPVYKDGHMPLIFCACGCGDEIPALDKKNQPRSFVPGHAGYLQRGKSKVDWKSRVTEWNRTALQCACGCGERLQRTQKQLRTQQYRPLFISGHGGRRGKCVTELTDIEKAVIYGSLLGDLSITRPSSGYPRLAFTHGISQRDYALHKMQKLERLHWRSREAQTSGYSENYGIQGNCSCLPVLEKVWDVVREGGGVEASHP
jgi:hypothetical protein